MHCLEELTQIVWSNNNGFVTVVVEYVPSLMSELWIGIISNESEKSYSQILNLCFGV